MLESEQQISKSAFYATSEYTDFSALTSSTTIIYT